ncbi:MAG: sensor histidine kinase [Caldilinea sp.]|nr:sensor histidine kinase [Caldilinea sp.]MCB0039648.1 sensor histidine kinase [Caldilinea sp.]MCB9115897.1 sensor histidine kinase [Caldilineaceae bacterium]MCB9120671.1 sensor histidine kinase [Caldilineaceae bacterium]MCW5844401.1 sensor histidine kinase [Caldilinea sp.]
MTWLTSALRLRNLRTQVMLWTVLPLTILLIVASLAGIGTHQASMRRLAVDENQRLAMIMARSLALNAADGLPEPSVLDALLKLESTTHATQVLLLDDAGQTLFAGGQGPAAPVNGEVVRQRRAVGRLETIEGAEYIVAYAPVPDLPWQLVLREPVAAIAEPLIRFEQATPFVLVIATVVSFLTLFFGLRFIVGPLRLLAERAQRIGAGDYAAIGEPVGGVGEIEALRKAIDQMAEQIKRYQAGLETYLLAITRAQEEERARLSRELHDETVQSLIAFDHKIQKIQRTLDRDPALAHSQLAELRHLLVDAIGEVRRFSQALRPLYLEDLGLAPALELLSTEFAAGFTLLGEPRRLAPEVELALYRIAQESLNNARRHASATQVEVTLTFQPEQSKLTICDDGVGFEPALTSADFTRGGHFGLMGMRERAQLVGANLQIATLPGQGVAVSVTVAG